METPGPGPQPRERARELLRELRSRFPVFRDQRPLALGIDRQLIERIPDVDRKLLRIALGMHTHSLAYLKALAKAAERVDLDGGPAGEVAASHQSHAAQLLGDLLRKQAEQRKAQRDSEALERRRAEKLGQLVAKFGRQR
ncbi:ProQ/FINO family protein [Accumulibacter sp.]|uniref:ProQ/FINO family protein n=1 Tax=Accumulibacter sp. TaxID=2053492 RepID=UPI0025D63461|nr:ProQ/FINO family protein [Accumulibacter sp.]MCM8594544.1 ProQ/FINO family protein [Accumulibacter sp.]MCM8627392.1 ProQ/FINO family protein [Accumulibacter sp.]MDS4048690.1 ProQ/FINO family protein [Accumulibacter sp.]